MPYTLRTEDLLEILHATDARSLRDRTLKVCQQLGYEFFVYGYQHPRQLLIHSTYPLSWQRLYVDQGMMEIDPTVRHVRHSCLPLIWVPETFAGAGGQEMYDAARAHCIRSGLSLAFRDSDGSPAMLSLASDLPMGEVRAAHSRETLPEALLVASYFNEAAKRLASLESSPPPPVAPLEAPPPQSSHPDGTAVPPGEPLTAPTEALTGREIECLEWSMAGKSSWETGRILGCTERTVNFHIGNAMRKFGVNNRRCAVVKALMLNLIRP